MLLSVLYCQMEISRCNCYSVEGGSCCLSLSEKKVGIFLSDISKYSSCPFILVFNVCKSLKVAFMHTVVVFLSTFSQLWINLSLLKVLPKHSVIDFISCHLNMNFLDQSIKHNDSCNKLLVVLPKLLSSLFES